MQFIKTLATALTLGALATGSAFAADLLNGTKWKTVDDKTGKPKAIVQFNKQADGSYSATIIENLDPMNKNGCVACTGKYKGKMLTGVTIVNGLKAKSDSEFADGTVLDPKTDKTYKFKANLSKDGKVLNGRGFVGVSLVGRNQTWYRAN